MAWRAKLHGMDSFPPGGIALVIGASGGIGNALVEQLRDLPVFSDVVGLSRQSGPSLDITSESSVAAAVKFLGAAEIRLVIDATGFLHDDGFTPEKSFKEISAAHMAKSFAINAVGPALLMKFLLPLLPRNGKAVFATLSAKVGSIGDNNIGGWYSYRAAKAARPHRCHRTPPQPAGRNLRFPPPRHGGHWAFSPLRKIRPARPPPRRSGSGFAHGHRGPVPSPVRRVF
jgi:NADP-dependent 3-hydroxy acid dehydrogenase YdfG